MQIIKEKTKSLCNVCFKQIPATVFEENERVYIRKCCPKHKASEGLVEKDADLYRRFAHIKLEGRPELDPLIIPITYRCNLDCKYCYAWSPKRKDMTLSQIRKVINNFSGQTIALSGGEPTVREDLESIIRISRQAGKYTNLVTHGLRLSNLKYLRSLKRAGLNKVFFSLDSFKDEFYNRMKRGKSGVKNILNLKKDALINLEIERIPTSLSVTIYPGLNDKELKDLFIFALKKSHFIDSFCIRSCVRVGRSRGDSKDGYFLSELLNLFSKQIKVDTKTLIDKCLISDYHTPHHITFYLRGYLRKGKFILYLKVKDKSNLKRMRVRIIRWPTVENIDIQELDRGKAQLYDRNKILNFCHAIILDSQKKGF
jgi:hypothetical protein